MKNLCYSAFILFLVFISGTVYGQNCATLDATFQTFESRCAATGAIKVLATGGSGSYKYRLEGPVQVNFTSTDSITGLAAGSYTVYVEDINTGCGFVKNGVVVAGNYADPRFKLTTVSVSCDNGQNGSITVEDVENGRAPFIFSIEAPSPMGVGTSDPIGYFTGLKGGDYSIRLRDSCGGIQTRTISVENYTWSIEAHYFEKFLCDSAKGWIRVVDSRGNVSAISGIPGMQYGLLVDGADTVWSSVSEFRFKVEVNTKTVKAFAKDACGNLKQITANVFLFPSIGANIAETNLTCSTFTASVTGMTNFFQPEFCIYNQSGTLIGCNSTGQFTGLSYGTYCIKARDLCADTVIERCFTVKRPVPFVDENLLISNKVCETFTATVTGQVNLADPEYCLYDSNNQLVKCNETGVFTDIPYGNYCIQIHDRCIDTVLTRCISVGKPMPFVNEVLHPSYLTCTKFGLNVGGDSLYNPIYCLIDDSNVTIDCNNTGRFDSIPYGRYCVTIYDECRDTTMQRCITVEPVTVINDMAVAEENKTCSTFTAHVYTSLLKGSKFSLYDDEHNLLDENNTGIFPGLPYGKYCVEANYPCPDTTVTTCIDAIQPVPKVNADFTATDKTCTYFTARVTGQANLTSPDYFLLNPAGDTIATNKTGVFESLTYGNYCIVVKDNCFDTSFKLCRTVFPPDFSFTVSATRSCNFGTTRLNITAVTYPVIVSVYNPSDVMILSRMLYKSGSIDSLPDLPAGQQYKIIAEDVCTSQQSAMISPVVNLFSEHVVVEPKCPGAEWSNGSGNIVANASTNTGNLTVRVIKKDGVDLIPNLIPDLAVSNSKFVFQDLGPGTYIVHFRTSDACKNSFYDTVTIAPYQYPNLDRSSAYQCDVNGFSVGAVVTNGVGPFTYEIIGSMPETPSIISGTQSSPVFTIDNGSSYSLIRLRALDACGNATLGDASILPLANSEIKTTSNCLGQQAILRIDTLYNGMVKWFYQKKKSDPDSVLIGEGFLHEVNPLTVTDTGFYYAKVDLNNGCITRLYEFNLNGNCYPVVQIARVELSGRAENGSNLLFWSVSNDQDLKSMVVERKTDTGFEALSLIKVSDYISPGQYRYFDRNPLTASYYRIKLNFNSGKVLYSKVINLHTPSQSKIRVYPNPATDVVHIQLNNGDFHGWKYELIHAVSKQTILKGEINSRSFSLNRGPNIPAGVYLIKLTDPKTGNISNHRIVFTNRK